MLTNDAPVAENDGIVYDVTAMESIQHELDKEVNADEKSIKDAQALDSLQEELDEIEVMENSILE